MKTKKIIILIIVAIIGCTNPEVDFPKENKQEEQKNKLEIKNPVIFVYQYPLSPLSFYFIITMAKANGASESMLRPVYYENLLGEIDSVYQFYGSKINLVLFWQDVENKFKEGKNKNYEDYINKKIFIGNPKCLNKNTEDIDIIKIEEKDTCNYDPLEYIEKLKDIEFIKTIIKKIGKGEIISTSLKEDVILLKGKTLPELDIILIGIDENKKEKPIFRTKSDIGGYFGPLILTPRNEIIIKLSKQDFELKIRLIGISNSYSYLELLPEIESKYIKMIFSKIKTNEIASLLKLDLKDEEKNINIDTLIVKDKGEGYKIDKNIFYIFNPKIDEINLKGIKINIKEKGAYYVFQ